MHGLVAGVDEAGRGPLAGPVYAAAVILDPDHRIEGLRDSKQLSAPRRALLSAQIRQHSLAWHIAWADVEEIDALNILGATLLAMRRAVCGLARTPELVQVDGNRPPDLGHRCVRVECVVRGDATVAAISAASILAKHARDELMQIDCHHLSRVPLPRAQGVPYGRPPGGAAATGSLAPAPAQLWTCAGSEKIIPEMSLQNFVHLRVHTEYSLLDSVVRVPGLIDAVAAAGMPAVALTDECNLFAMVKFYRAAIARGVKPIIGVDLLLREPGEREAPCRLTLLCQNEAGYLNLSRLVTRAYLEGERQATPLVEKAWLTRESLSGLIALSGGWEGDVGRALLLGRPALARRAVQAWQALFDDRYYLELQRTGRATDGEYVAAAVALAGEFNVPVVATNDVRFLDETEYEAHEARVCIRERALLADPARRRRYTREQFLRYPGTDGRTVRRHPGSLAQQRGNCASLQPAAEARDQPPAGVSGSRRIQCGRLDPQVGGHRPCRTPRRAQVPGHRRHAQGGIRRTPQA